MYFTLRLCNVLEKLGIFMTLFQADSQDVTEVQLLFTSFNKSTEISVYRNLYTQSSIFRSSKVTGRLTPFVGKFHVKLRPVHSLLY